MNKIQKRSLIIALDVNGLKVSEKSIPAAICKYFSTFYWQIHYEKSLMTALE